MPKPRSTMVDVANEAGVSYSTVYHALSPSGTKVIAADTRKRINAAVKKLKFKPIDHQRVTKASIARDLGVSHTTVSLALAGSERVSAKTRKEIKTHAKKVGYKA